MEQYHKTCLICQSNKITDLADFSSHHLSKCKKCGFVFAKKIPTQEELAVYYQGYGRDDYLSPVTIKRYNELLDTMEKYRKTNRILDVGCGVGYFLEVAKKRGWEVYGTEFTEKAVCICEQKGIAMQEGPLEVSHYEPESFDVLTSFEVIEHINNPKEEVAKFRCLLREGGLVYLTTPNFNSLLRYYLKDKYNVICYPEHLCYYTPKTIARLFKNSGFKKLSVHSTGISLTRFKTSKKISAEKFVSQTSTDEQLRNKIETNKSLQLAKVMANQTLTLFGCGDSLKAFFVK
ncbi:class I SAM-dependent methyltransferase [Rapidithrix thailandica]|uniref:Class I SAM-dependent methyltransferase n=1 Tax=Rapidithrix thailandica TaxID=413964 RepID=A0AAW9SFX9_9BACT